MEKPLICLLIQCSPLWASGSPAEGRLTAMGHSENPSPLSWTPQGLQRSWRRPLHKLWGHTRLRWDLGRLRSQLQLPSGIRQVPVPFCTSVLPWKIEIFILTCPSVGAVVREWGEGRDSCDRATYQERRGFRAGTSMCMCVRLVHTDIHTWACLGRDAHLCIDYLHVCMHTYL